jgi:hypothetical protein
MGVSCIEFHLHHYKVQKLFADIHHVTWFTWLQSMNDSSFVQLMFKWFVFLLSPFFISFSLVSTQHFLAGFLSRSNPLDLTFLIC